MKRVARVLKRVAFYLTVAVCGFVVGVVGLYVYLVRSGPDLEIWHTEPLKAEFTADRTDIRSFDGYVALEDELFAQLDDRIYARTPTGPEFALVRYSRGSAADPRAFSPDWNRSFELPTEEPVGGVLLLHGMSDSPYSFRALGTSLNARGYHVIGLRLPGHGTAPSGLTSMTWEDMAAAVRLGAQHLASVVGPNAVHIMGYSNGAPLAVNYTLDAMDDSGDPVPGSLVLISPSIGITRAAALAKWKGRMAYVPGLQKFAWTSVLPEFDPFKYNSFSTNAGNQVHRLTVAVRQRIETIAADGPIDAFPPTLVLLSTVDATVSVDAVIDNLLEHLGPRKHELILFDLDRSDVSASVLVEDPGPLTHRLLDDDSLPFHLSVITNESVDSTAIVCRRKPPFSTDLTIEPLATHWPPGVISLSHVALPFPPDDPLYGLRKHAPANVINLGQLEIQGERGLLIFPADWLLRLRHNPFYGFLERCTLDWVDEASGSATDPID